MNLKIEQQCPQCGAPLSLNETERILECSYCRVRHLLNWSSYPAYFFSPLSQVGGGELFYFPYWRMRGLAMAVSGLNLKCRILDTSLQALSSKKLPSSLGISSQAVPLRFVQQDILGKFLRPKLEGREFEKSIAARFLGVESLQGETLQAFVGEMVSQIYLPFWLKNGTIFDGFRGQELGSIDFEPEQVKNLNTPLFEPALCPYCGGDLKGKSFSLVLGCSSCERSWMFSNQGLRQIQAFVTGRWNRQVLGLPFWRIQIECSGVSLSSWADLIRFTNLPQVVLEKMETQPLYFWVPAFKVHSELFLRLAKQITLAQPEISKEENIGHSFPVRLPISEGFQSLPIVLAQLTLAKKNFFSQIQGSKIKFLGGRLVFIPFKEQGCEFIQEDWGVAILKNAVHWGLTI